MLKQKIFSLIILLLMTVYCQAQEICNNNIDDDGDGLIDCLDCADCASFVNCSNGTDTDNDGIPDACDLDDDNDGILDADEGLACEAIGGTAFPPYNYQNCSNSSGGKLFTNIGTYNGQAIDLVVTNAGPGSFVCGNTGNLGCTSGDNGFTYENAKSNTTLTFAFYLNNTTTPVTINWALNLDDFDDPEGIEIPNSATYSYQLNPLNNTTITDLGSSTRFESNDNTNDEISFYFYDITSLTIGFKNTGERDFCFNSSVGFSIPNGSCTVTERDTDNDGTPNHLDLDSDNDGCPDALEGDGNIWVANLFNDRIDGTVDSDGVPTFANGGQGVGTSQDNTATLGCDEICNDGQDNDGDGLIDCLDCADCSNASNCSNSVPDISTFNTGTNATATNVRANGADDLNWTVSTNGLSGTYNPAKVLGTNVPSVYYQSPYPNATWIAHSTTGEHSANANFFYKLVFDLPCNNNGCLPIEVEDAFCLNLEFYADNDVREIYINGHPQSSYNGGSFGGGFGQGGGSNISLCRDWQAGSNEVIVRISSTPGFAAFLAQASTNPVNSNDTDSDGIPDFCDLDDDNDGILDEEECVPIVENGSFETPAITSPYVNNIGSISGWTTISGSFDLHAPQVANSSDGSQHIDLQTTNNSPPGVIEKVFNVGQSGIPYNFSIDYSGAKTTASANVIVDGVVVASISDPTPAPNLSQPLILTWETFTYSGISTGNTVSIRFENTGLATSYWGLFLDNFQFDTFCSDTDNDGILNSLDLDSDGDGCFDVVESGGLDLNNDGMLDGTGIDSDGLVIGGTGGYDGANSTEMNAVQVIIISQPINLTRNNGQSATFSVTAQGDVATQYSNGTPLYGTPNNANSGLRYQWYNGTPGFGGVALSDGGVYNGTTTNTLNISEVTGLNGTQYCVVVTHADNVCIEEIRCAILSVTTDELCNDGQDNDGDGLIDCADPDCAPVIASVIPTPLSCPLGNNNGQIVITATGLGTLTYSITNEPNYQSSNIFQNLGQGLYTISVLSSTGCSATYDAAVVQLNSPSCPEICDDGIDNDGDGDVDCDDADCGNIETATTINNN